MASVRWTLPLDPAGAFAECLRNSHLEVARALRPTSNDHCQLRRRDDAHQADRGHPSYARLGKRIDLHTELHSL